MIEDIIVSDEDTPIKFTFTGQVKAIVINHGDHAYVKVRYDKKTLDTFERELCKIDEYMERCVVWRQLWYHVTDKKMSSLQYFNFVVKQLPNETVEQAIENILM